MFSIKKVIQLLTVVFLLINFGITRVTYAQVLQVTLNTSKLQYGLGEEVVTNGTLSVGTSPVNGLVALQIIDPHDFDFLFRVCSTGTPSGPWNVEILEVFTCYDDGTPHDSFKRGTLAYVSITVQNNKDTSQYCLISLSLYDASNVPLLTTICFAGEIPPGSNPPMIVSLPIPTEASPGIATLYADILTGKPRYNGYAYSPEKTHNFTLTTTSGYTTTSNHPLPPFETYLSPYGSYEIVFCLPNMGILGNYTIYASCKYQSLYDQTTKKFEVILLGDVNDDGKVDITDIAMVIAAYGSTPGSPRWDPKLDLDDSLSIDVTDVSIVIAQYGNTGTY